MLSSLPAPQTGTANLPKDASLVTGDTVRRWFTVGLKKAYDSGDEKTQLEVVEQPEYLHVLLLLTEDLFWPLTIVEQLFWWVMCNLYYLLKFPYYTVFHQFHTAVRGPTTLYLKWIAPNPSVVLNFSCLKVALLSSTEGRRFLCLHL